MAGCGLCALLYWTLSSTEADINNCGSSMSTAALYLLQPALCNCCLLPLVSLILVINLVIFCEMDKNIAVWPLMPLAKVKGVECGCLPM